MFDVAPTELIVVALVALLVIGPKDLPRALHHLGKWMGKMRGMARHFRTGLDTMVREAELAEMEKKWAEDNARIMRDYPDATPTAEPALPPPPAAEPTTEPVAPPPAAEEGGR
ncbi:Sec-independent protein translocase protein TatB [Sphingomonas flavalba]|uniref:Sec-independent protein translocase protein TatB n=1 Tax=Sphingomonas flavalba TaxID=2559804 RepID=UPI0039E18B20